MTKKLFSWLTLVLVLCNKTINTKSLLNLESLFDILNVNIMICSRYATIHGSVFSHESQHS